MTCLREDRLGKVLFFFLSTLEMHRLMGARLCGGATVCCAATQSHLQNKLEYDQGKASMPTLDGIS